MTTYRAQTWGIALLFVVSACSSGGGGDPNGAGGVPATGGAPTGGISSATGGVPAGGPGVATGGASGAPAGGASGVPAVPAGQLTCAGKLCHAGGRCAADRTCPAFLGGCFTGADNIDNCDQYCTAHGFVCAYQSCASDGSPAMTGYSTVSFPASQRASCDMGGVPVNSGFDMCNSPIWLSPQKPLDDVVRCCCKG